MQGAAVLCILILVGLFFYLRGSQSPFERYANDPAFRLTDEPVDLAGKADPFAADLCIVDPDEDGAGEGNYPGVGEYGLFALDSRETLLSHNMLKKTFPASITKMVTALVAIESGMDLNTTLTAGADVEDMPDDAQTISLRQGDQMTLLQALNYMMVYSANDAAVLIADSVGGSSEKFVGMMNEKARSVGAVHTHFTNANGLHDENHYTTGYDIYLMFNECLKNEEFTKIIDQRSYTSTFRGADGADREVTVPSTDFFLTGDEAEPEGFDILGGKTGTTDPAGHCLTITSKDSQGHRYISTVLKAQELDQVYSTQRSILESAQKQ